MAGPPNFALKFEAPISKAGDHVVLKAEMDCIVAFSSCPQDILPINVCPLLKRSYLCHGSACCMPRHDFPEPFG